MRLPLKTLCMTALVAFFSTSLGRTAEPAPAKPAEEAEVLTNEAIIEMVNGKIAESVILKFIKDAAGCNFDVSRKGIMQLSKANVPETIQLAMQDAMSRSRLKTTAQSKAQPTGGAPNQSESVLPRAVGVYLFEEQNGQAKYSKIARESATIVGGGGPFGGSQRAVLAGARSKLQLKSRRPVFYMRLGQSDESLDGQRTPAELPLARLDIKQKKDITERTVVIGSHAANPWGGSSRTGIPTKSLVAFEETEIEPGVFKILPQEDLPDGEYAFARVSGGFAIAAGTMFTFGIHSDE